MYNSDDFFLKLDRYLFESKVKFEKNWFIDHICYRTKDLEEYERVKSDYSSENELLVESVVGGRLIATYKLSSPIRYKNYTIPLIEIPSPKEGRVAQSGFEHIEIVVKESFEDLQKRFSHLNLKTHALTKKLNPELEIEFKDIAVKFHHQSLEEVIEYEKSLD